MLSNHNTIIITGKRIISLEIYIYIYTHTHIHTHTMEYLFSHKKEEIIAFTTTWMECEVIMLNEISHIEKDKYCVISLMCGI